MNTDKAITNGAYERLCKAALDEAGETCAVNKDDLGMLLLAFSIERQKSEGHRHNEKTS